MARPGPTIIDGSLLEGGGQILRNSAALAAILGAPLRVDSIRAGRKKPGLAKQHLAGLQLVHRLSSGELEGAAVGSTCISFRPHQLRGGATFLADTQTAGSCTLLAQVALPCCLFAQTAATDADGHAAPTVLELKGGTDAAMAPPAEYLRDVVAPLLRAQLGVAVGVQLVKRGFFPAGGGELRVTVPALAPGSALPPISLMDPGQIECLRVHAFAAGRIPLDLAAGMAAAAVATLRAALGPGVRVEQQVVQETRASARGDGAGVSIVAETTTGCLLGATGRLERGDVAEVVGRATAEELLQPLLAGACVDQWMQDQLIIFMALASGTSRMLCEEPTLHTRTAVSIAEQMLPGAKFAVVPAVAAAATAAGRAVPAPAGGALGGAGARLWCIECVGAGIVRS